MLSQIVECDSPDCGVEQKLVVEQGVAILPDGWIQTVLTDSAGRRQMHFDTPACMDIYLTGAQHELGALASPRLVTETVRELDPVAWGDEG